MTKTTLIRAASIAGLLLAGSCAAPMNDGDMQVSDPAANHPIAVEMHATSLDLAPPSAAGELDPAEAAHLGAFIAEYLDHGSGALSLSVPAGRDAQGAIAYFGEKLASLGVPRTRIMVGTREGGENKVRLGYVAYAAKLEECGDWSDNVADTTANQPMKNFGCAVQRNIAAQVANPRDLVAPQPLDDADAMRRAVVMGQYQAGKPTAAEKTEDQKGTVSDVQK
jgi:pilus assembly protein CpaD